MDHSELIDFRQNNAPIALWESMVVLDVHHDGGGEMPAEWRIRARQLVYETLALLDASLPPRITFNSDGWLVQNWTAFAPVHC